MNDESTLADRLRDECENHQHDDYCYCGLFMEAAVTVESQADRIVELEEQIDVLEGMNASRADRIAELEAKLAEERQNHADLMHKMGER